MTSSLSNQNLNIDSLLTMKSTVSLVKTTAKAMIDAEKLKVSDKNESTSESTNNSNYVEAMDYDEDGKVTINEQLRYYTEQTAQSIRKSLSTPYKSTSLNFEDYKNAGMEGYFDAQINLKFSKAFSAYSYNQAMMQNLKINTFNIGV